MRHDDVPDRVRKRDREKSEPAKEKTSGARDSSGSRLFNRLISSWIHVDKIAIARLGAGRYTVYDSKVPKVNINMYVAFDCLEVYCKSALGW